MLDMDGKHLSTLPYKQLRRVVLLGGRGGVQVEAGRPLGTIYSRKPRSIYVFYCEHIACFVLHVRVVRFCTWRRRP